MTLREKIEAVLVLVSKRDVYINNATDRILEILDEEKTKQKEHDSSWDNFKPGDMK
jgi:hypothetical protein